VHAPHQIAAPVSDFSIAISAQRGSAAARRAKAA